MSKTTKLTAAERSRRYRDRIKLDKERNEDYKRKMKERNAKRLKRGDMPKRILQRVRAKEKEYVRGKRESERKNKFPLSNSGSSATTPACATPGSISIVALELSANEAEMLPTPTELNIIKKQKKRYTNQLKQRNKQLQLQIELLTNRLKESERGKQKYKKRCQRYKKKVQEKSNKVLSFSCNNLKQSLANFREKYKERTSIYPLVGLKILKRYRLKKLIATKKKVIKKSRTCMSKINAVKQSLRSKKETVTSGKIKKQKRYLCDTMKNLYEIFKSENIGIDLGAVIKRTADALVAHGLDIADAEKLYHSLLGKTNVELFYVTPKEIFNNNKILLKNIKTVPSTRDIHQVITRSRGEIIHRNLSCFCNTNNWLTGKLCYCHKLNQKVAKIGFKQNNFL